MGKSQIFKFDELSIETPSSPFRTLNNSVINGRVITMVKSGVDSMHFPRALM